MRTGPDIETGVAETLDDLRIWACVELGSSLNAVREYENLQGNIV
jgi:hypothetical protein